MATNSKYSKVTLTYTANDTFPTVIQLSDGDTTGYTVAMEIDYAADPLVTRTVLIKTATPTNPGVGTYQLEWISGDLIEGTWDAKITIVNTSGKKISSEFIKLIIDRDITQ